MEDTKIALVKHEEMPLTAVEIREQVNLIQEVMKAVMKGGQHYGIIPGCGDKPALFKSGAEKIMMTFRLSADPQVEDLSTVDIIRYRVKCNMLTQSGIFKGAGIGECSSEEEKYKWRTAISEAEWNETLETQKRLKYKKDGEIKQVRTNPYDLANTILKMAKKRALIDGILTVVGASDIFTQDIEDMSDENISHDKSPIQPPQAKPQTSQPAEKTKQETATENKLIITYIKDVTEKTGQKDNKPWKKYTILGSGINDEYNTFSENIAMEAQRALEIGLQAKIEYKVGKYGNDIISLEVIEPTDKELKSKGIPY